MEDYPRHHKQLRRYDTPGHARALNFACFHDRPFLRSARACEWFVKSTTRALHKHHVDLWAWCIMPTHVHILVFPRSPAPHIASFLESLKKSVTRYAVAWTQANAPDRLSVMEDVQLNGKVTYRFWQRGGGYDRNMTTSRAIWSQIRYVHLNPVRDGLVDQAQDWPWSSAGFYFDRRPSAIPLQLEKLSAKEHDG